MLRIILKSMEMVFFSKHGVKSILDLILFFFYLTSLSFLVILEKSFIDFVMVLLDENKLKNKILN